MAKFKIWMVALTLIMGVSLSSCFNSENDPIFKNWAYTKCVSFYPPTFQLDNGQKLVFSGLSTASFNEGEAYIVYFQFDTEQQSMDAPTINVTPYGGVEPIPLNAKSSEGPTSISESTKANSPVYAISGTIPTAKGNANIDPFVLFNNEYLFASPAYWVANVSGEEKIKEELDKHAFIMTYDPESIKSGDTELVLTLNHVITDTSETEVVRDRYTNTIKAYRLTYALNDFELKAGNKPTKITLKAQTNRAKNDLEGAVEEVWEYTVK